MNYILKLNNIYLLVVTVCIFTLLSAVYIEYILNVRPCILCIKECPISLQFLYAFLAIII